MDILLILHISDQHLLIISCCYRAFAEMHGWWLGGVDRQIMGSIPGRNIVGQ